LWTGGIRNHGDDSIDWTSEQHGANSMCRVKDFQDDISNQSLPSIQDGYSEFGGKTQSCLEATPRHKGFCNGTLLQGQALRNKKFGNRSHSGGRTLGESYHFDVDLSEFVVSDYEFLQLLVLVHHS